jgi:hypothetical protein
MSIPPEWEYRQRIQELLRGYRPAQVLITCAELGVFEALHAAPASAEDLSQRLGTSPLGLARLLNVAVALGLLEKHGGYYANSAISAACLAGEGPFYLGNLVRREGAFYRRWSRLTEAVRTSRRPEENVRDEGGTNWVRDFELALYDVARTTAPAIAEALGSLLPQWIGKPIRVIDVGGGHGAYSMALARRYRNVEAVVFELPAAAEVAREIVGASDVANRVGVRSGDFKTDDLGADFELALLFGVLVSEPPADAIALLKKIHAALVPGGLVAIRGFYLDPDRTHPPDAALFDLQMLLSTGAGAAYTVDDVVTWLSEAGFLPVETVHLPPPEGTSLLVARTPSAHQ